MLLTNAFSFNMCPGDLVIRKQHIDTLKVIELLRATGVDSAVGHANTAAMLSGLLGMTVVANRRNLHLGHGDKCIVAQYCGPRLPEEAAKLPEGARIDWLLVEIC